THALRVRGGLARGTPGQTNDSGLQRLRLVECDTPGDDQNAIGPNSLRLHEVGADCESLKANDQSSPCATLLQLTRKTRARVGRESSATRPRIHAFRAIGLIEMRATEK